VPVALAVVAGIVLDRHGPPVSTRNWALVAVGLGVVALVGSRRGCVVYPAVLGTLLVLAGSWHHHRWDDVAADDLARVVDDPTPSWVRGTLADVIGFRPSFDGEGDGVTRAVLDVCAVHDRGEWRAASGVVALTVVGDRTDLRAGQSVEAAGTLSAVRGPLNPGEFDYRAYLRTQGVRLKMTAHSPEGVWRAEGSPSGAGEGVLTRVRRSHRQLLGAARAWGRERLAAVIDPAEAPLAEALLLGRREGWTPT
jgi:competence protein ComEC